MTDGWLSDVNPSDEADVIGSVPVGSSEDTARAAVAAEAAMAGWQALSGPDRAEYLHRWAGAIQPRSGELAEMMVREVGKPLGEARGEVARCVTILRYYAGEAVRSMGQVIPAQAANSLQFTLRQPVGPVALITPWNFPLAIPLWKAAPALAYGNTAAARNIKYHLEMGGKNVAIVLADADLDQAALLVAAGAMRYAGQKCTATSRVVVCRH